MQRPTFTDRAIAAKERGKDVVNSYSQALSKSARSLISGDAQYFNSVPKIERIREQLADNNLWQKKEGMKRVIAGIGKGADMSVLFADVVKNIHVQSIELRKLIYHYIVYYADERPNEALLSISAFQKDLLDSSMHVRSLALRTLSSIKILSIAPVVMIAIRKCATDIAAVVRKSAIISLAQTYSFTRQKPDEDSLQLVGKLLNDQSIEVVGAAAATYLQICSDNFELIHPVYYRLCKRLIECNEWGQVVIMEVLLRYGMMHFKNISGAEYEGEQLYFSKKEESSRAGSTCLSSDSSSDNGNVAVNDLLHKDHRLLLNCVSPLLRSTNKSVAMMAISTYYYLSPKEERRSCVKPLLRILHTDKESLPVILCFVYAISKKEPELFAPYTTDFYLLSGDDSLTQKLKIAILAIIANDDNIEMILNELTAYIHSFDINKVANSINGLSTIAEKHPEQATHVLTILLSLLSHKSCVVVNECVSVLNKFVMNSKMSINTTTVIQRLVVHLLRGNVRTSASRAAIIRLVAESIKSNCGVAAIAPDLLRMLLKNFSSETREVKKQILLLGIIIWISIDGTGKQSANFEEMLSYLLELVKYDDDYQLRAAGRLVESTRERTGTAFETMKTILLKESLPPQPTSSFDEKLLFNLESFSSLLGTRLFGYCVLPPRPLNDLEVAERNVVAQPVETLFEVENESSETEDEGDYEEKTDSEFDGYTNSLAGTEDESDEESDEEQPLSVMTRKILLPSGDKKSD